MITFRNSAAFLMLFFVLTCTNLPCWAGPRGENSFSKGMAYYQQGDFTRALQAFTEAVKGSSDGDAYLYLGMTQAQLGRNEDAVLSLERAAELDPDLKGVHLNLGIAYYKLGVFGPARLELNRALQEDPESGSAHFFIGLTMREEGRYQGSIESFRRAMSLDPDFTQSAWYQIGLAHYRAGENAEAVEAFEKTVKTNPDTDTAREAEQFLKTLAAPERGTKPWWAKAGVGLEYDDNLTVEEKDVVSEQGDWAAVFEVEGGYRFLDRHPYEGTITYDFYQSLYADLSQFDLQSHTLGISGERDFGNWDAGLEYDYAYMLLDGEGFLGTHSIVPRIGASLRPDIYLSAHYMFQDKDFREEENDPRDGVNHSVGFDVFYFFMDSRAYAQVGCRLEEEDTAGEEFDYAGHEVSASVQVPTPYQGRLRLAYRYHFKDYDSVTSGIGERREDRRQTFNLSWKRTLYENVEVKADYRYIDSDSNLPSSDYKENIIFLGLSVSL